MEYNPKQLQIIAVAERLFAARGFSGTSIRDISQEADINISMVSYYFGSKDKLIEALFTLRATEFRQRLEVLLANADLSPDQQVDLMIDGVIDRLVEKQCFHNIVVREQLMTDSRTPIISELLKDLKINNLKAMENIVQNGQNLGVFRHDVDVLMLSTAMFGTINQALATKPFYRAINGMEHVPEDILETDIRQRLSVHLKKLFKDSLSKELNRAVDS